MLDFMIEKISVWDALRTAQKPIVLYGMGNGADKILDWCADNKVQEIGRHATGSIRALPNF